MPTYQPLIPTGTVNLDVDYRNIQGNFEQSNIVFAIDHVPFDNNTAQKGYHKDIHFNPFSTTTTSPPTNYVTADQFPAQGTIPPGAPPTIAGIGQLFSAQVNDGASTDTGLYWLTGNGLKVAMTRNFSPVRAINGYTFLPGGLIMQWGVKSGITNTVPPVVVGPVQPNRVTFPLTFPNAVFSITLGAVRADGSQQVVSIYNANISTASFYLVTGSNNYTSVHWHAIGY